MARIWADDMNTWIISGKPMVGTPRAGGMGSMPIDGRWYSTNAYAYYPLNKTYSALTGGSVFVKFYFKITTLPNATMTMIDMWSSTDYVFELALTNTGVIKLMEWSNDYVAANAVQRGSDSAALTVGEWYLVEFSYNYDTGATEVKIDGASAITGNFAASRAYKDLEVMWEYRAVATWFSLVYDDLVINDSTGSAQNTYPGAGVIANVYSNAAGDTNTMSIGTYAVWQDDGNPFLGNNSGYFEANANGQIIDANMDTVANIGIPEYASITGVGVNYYVDGTVANLWRFKSRIKSAASGTVDNDLNYSEATSAKRYLAAFSDSDPSGSGAWTRTLIETMQVGAEITTVPSGSVLDCYYTQAYVEFVDTNPLGRQDTDSARTQIGSRTNASSRTAASGRTLAT